MSIYFRKKEEKLLSNYSEVGVIGGKMGVKMEKRDCNSLIL